MGATLQAYFEGEKNAGLLVAGIGLVMLASAALFWPARLSLRPFAITLAVWGLLELAIGVGLYLKTGPQVSRLAAQLASDSGGFYAAERPRMEAVQRNFVILEVVWLGLIVGAAATAVWWKDRFAVTAVALGILVNASVILAFDLVAERRGAVYLAALRSGPR